LHVRSPVRNPQYLTFSEVLMALVAEGVAPDADDAGEKGQKIQEQKNRQHDKTIRKGRDASQ
jgi:hypothetical protein